MLNDYLHHNRGGGSKPHQISEHKWATLFAPVKTGICLMYFES
jgi:hypothetical protein